MKITLMACYGVIICTLLTGCVAYRSRYEQQTQQKPKDLLFTIQWVGSISKPVYEAGFATTNRANELKEWIDGLPNLRWGALLSESEYLNVSKLFSQQFFVSRRTTNEISTDNVVPQYFVTTYSDGKTWYIPLGVESPAGREVYFIREALARPSRTLLDPIIDYMDRLERNGKTQPK
jgi:hypothetical protein